MLTVKIKNIEFKSPIMVASGTFGYGDEVKNLVDISQIGCIITKSVTLNPREGNPPPRIHETSSGMLNSIGLANVGVDDFCNNKLPYLNNMGNKFIINIFVNCCYIVLFLNSVSYFTILIQNLIIMN